jgi:hypothetical protein
MWPWVAEEWHLSALFQRGQGFLATVLEERVQVIRPKPAGIGKFRRKGDVLEVAETLAYGQPGKLGDAGYEDETDVFVRFLEAAVEIAKRLGAGLGRLKIGHAVQYGSVVLVDQNDRLGAMLSVEGLGELFQATARAYGFNFQVFVCRNFLEPVDDVLPQQYIGASFINGKVFPVEFQAEKDNRAGSEILAGGLYGQPLKKFSPAREEFFYGGKKEGLAKAPGTGQEDLLYDLSIRRMRLVLSA